MTFHSAAFQRLLDQYGQDVSIYPEGGALDIPVRAFLQPVLHQRENRLQRQPSPLGWREKGLYLYLGPAGVPLDRLGDGYLESRGRRFDVQSAEEIRVGTGVSHWWALLSPREEDDACP